MKGLSWPRRIVVVLCLLVGLAGIGLMTFALTTSYPELARDADHVANAHAAGAFESNHRVSREDVEKAQGHASAELTLGLLFGGAGLIVAATGIIVWRAGRRRAVHGAARLAPSP